MLLTGLAGAAVLPLTACTGEPTPNKPDPLEELAAQARSDADLAKAIAAAHPSLAAKVDAVATDRRAHHGAIEKELNRARPARVSTTATPAPAPAPSAPQQASAALSALKDAITTGEKRAAELVPSLPKHRAGLIGSVAASCACLREVLA
ncbi:hypothetical protein NLX83_01110 [Allokutzneria sp. A3M-2-11 16]|uniref:hypothetical protein n=1 Tax=Allokutzneria sp. A3M-2-11 16 TaxID=2962043 RepID=UPI0020B73BBB|nr:hypothetical protein [Allokutzneria sp. A3M-2-11 16]MCP3797849.1 hypothetical protein [Allokutzneria sp. A3M-2-11 16]